MSYATIDDIESLFRNLSETEEERAEALIPIVEDRIRQEAMNRGKDIDSMVIEGTLNKDVLMSVIVDVVARTLMTSTDHEPMTQYSESALGYSSSGTFLSPGGGIFIKDSELKLLGIKKQKIGFFNLC